MTEQTKSFLERVTASMNMPNSEFIQIDEKTIKVISKHLKDSQSLKYLIRFSPYKVIDYSSITEEIYTDVGETNSEFEKLKRNMNRAGCMGPTQGSSKITLTEKNNVVTAKRVFKYEFFNPPYLSNVKVTGKITTIMKLSVPVDSSTSTC